MLVRSKRGWEMAERDATPESLFHDRRRLVTAIAAGPILAPMALSALSGTARAAAPPADPSAGLYPAMGNMRYRLDRDVTPEKDATTYNNFYEYGTSKNIWEEAQQLKIRPWTVKIDGMVEKPMELGIDDLLKKVKLEERLYRHRCVEAWAMAVPWSGFPMKSLVEIAKPTSGAKYIVMQTLADKKQMPGLRNFMFPWPYIEGVTMAEAMNELAFLVTGMYGKPVPRQDGAPLRLALPWKYGFKSVKSIVRFTFSDKRPKTFWAEAGPSEYGFWANVNPKVPHPRWSQATEEVLGKGNRVPTQLYNGYGEFVADLYKDMKGENLFM
jgi:methionine sulfoxide reductase catalytic subunit